MPDLSLDELLPPCESTVPDVVSDDQGECPRERRIGVMIHFDDSSSDTSADGWFRAKGFRLNYNRAYHDNGTRIRLTRRMSLIAPHAGVCLREEGLRDATLGGTTFRYGQANAGYYGLAITAGLHDVVADRQFAAIAEDAAVICRYHGWPAAEVERRIVGHNEKAICNPRDEPNLPRLWGFLGRKVDPIGTDPNHPVLSLASLRAAVAALLDAPTHPIFSRFA
jgi:hypothetical protein